jgi:RimJ/RimL family protein N-acetyltransferase
MMHLLSDPRVHRFLPSDPPTDEVALTQRLKRLESRHSPDGREDLLNWVVFQSETAIGMVQATVRPAEGTAAVAYLFHPDGWGQGYATEAMRALLEHLQRDVGVQRFSANIDTRNLASQRLIERLGFVRIGEIKDADAFKGSSGDEYVYQWRPPSESR